MHIEVTVEKLKRKFNVDVELQAPKVPYKETIKGRAEAQGKYKRQSGGRGQYGDCWLKVEPLPRGGGFEFVDDIVGGSIPRQFIPSVEKGVRNTLVEGFLAGFPMVDVKVTVYDGSYHDVDSSDMAFQIAASMGLQERLRKGQADPARTGDGGRCHLSRRMHGRRHRRPQLAPRPCARDGHARAAGR